MSDQGWVTSGERIWALTYGLDNFPIVVLVRGGSVLVGIEHQFCALSDAAAHQLARIVTEAADAAEAAPEVAAP